MPFEKSSQKGRELEFVCLARTAISSVEVFEG
jgi:hypothetical protein